MLLLEIVYAGDAGGTYGTEAFAEGRRSKDK